MNLKLNLRNPEVQQGIMEFIFPLLGYFFWGWSLVIIIVFYLLDWIASQIMYTKRLDKVKNQFNEKFNWVLSLSISFSIILIMAVSIILYFYFRTAHSIELSKDLNLELITFLKAELWYLLPLIIFSYYIMDRLLFYTPKRFTNYSVRPYLYKNMKANSIAFAFIIIGVIIHSYINLSEILTVIAIVIGKLIFDTVIKKGILKIK